MTIRDYINRHSNADVAPIKDSFYFLAIIAVCVAMAWLSENMVLIGE